MHSHHLQWRCRHRLQLLQPIHLEPLPVALPLRAKPPTTTTPKHALPQPAPEGPGPKQPRQKAFPGALQETPKVGAPTPKGSTRGFFLLSNQRKHLQHKNNDLHHLAQLQLYLSKLHVQIKLKLLKKHFERPRRTRFRSLKEGTRIRSVYHMSGFQRTLIGHIPFANSFGHCSQDIQFQGSRNQNFECSARRFQS